MIITWILTFIITVLSAIFSIMPTVTTIPPIGGYDIDTALVTGVAQAYTLFNSVWPITDVLLGAAFMWAYFTIKVLLRIILGHRAPQ